VIYRREKDYDTCGTEKEVGSKERNLDLMEERRKNSASLDPFSHGYTCKQ
jgi:hypothetical protein